MRLFGFKPEDGAAAGDAMPFYWNGEWHVFYLKPGLGAWGYPDRTRNSMAHIVSRDLVHWHVMPDAFGPGNRGSVDGDGIWTGSVIEHEGTFHFFYTGYSRDHANPQRICHAISPDLVHWTKNAANPLFGPDPRWYEPIDWRDPFIYRDEESGRFTMLIAARENEGPALRRGCIAIATSPDLISWKVAEPLWRPRITHVMECPELFQLGDHWYLVFSRYSEQAQTIYRVSRSPDGPWESRALESLDGRRFYAAKSASDDVRRATFAWTHERTHERADGDWEWGGHFGSPRELVSLPDGTLISRLPPAILDTYGADLPFELEGQGREWSREGASIEGCAAGTYAHAFLDLTRPDELLLEAEIEIEAGTHSAGLLIETDGGLATGYFIAIEPQRSRVVLNRWPKPMDPLWQRLAPGAIAAPEVDNPLVERHLPIPPANNRFRVRLLRKGSMLECFVADQVAITYRIYDEREKALGLFVQEGAARFCDLRVRVG